MALPLPEFLMLYEYAHALHQQDQAESFVIMRAAMHADEQAARELLYRLRGG
jgi:hypothetical protein